MSGSLLRLRLRLPTGLVVSPSIIICLFVCRSAQDIQSPVTNSPVTPLITRHNFSTPNTTSHHCASRSPVRQSQSPGHSLTCTGTAPRQPRFVAPHRTSSHFTSHPLLLRASASASASSRPFLSPQNDHHTPAVRAAVVDVDQALLKEGDKEETNLVILTILGRPSLARGRNRNTDRPTNTA